jgi:uncharacterized membrane protein YqjE
MRLLLQLLTAGPHLLATCHTWFQIQLDLLRIEFALEKQRLIDGLLMMMIAWVLLVVGVLMLTALALILSWDSFKIPMLVILGFLFLSMGVLLLVGARRKFQVGCEMPRLKSARKSD